MGRHISRQDRSTTKRTAAVEGGSPAPKAARNKQTKPGAHASHGRTSGDAVEPRRARADSRQGTGPAAPPPRPTRHTVVAGESMETIAHAHGIRTRTLRLANPNVNPNAMRIGTELRLPRERPVIRTRTLNRTADHHFTYSDLRATIAAAARAHGVSADIIAGIIAQESSFTNLLVHEDEHGIGLCGLDPRGELANYYRWAGAPIPSVDAPRTALTPELQIEFLALRLSELRTDNGGDIWGAVAAWHTGGPNDSDYIERVQAKMRQVARGQFG